MASGPLPKRVACHVCGAPQGKPCVDKSQLTLDRKGFKRVSTHKEREAAALAWYDRVSPDGLTPRRRDAMVEALGARVRRRGDVGALMEKITRAEDSEAEFERALVGLG